MRFILTVLLILGFAPAHAQGTIKSFFQNCDAMVEALIVAEVVAADGGEDAQNALQVRRQQAVFECSGFMNYVCNIQTDPKDCLQTLGDLYLDDAMESRAVLKDLQEPNPFTARRFERWAAQSREDVLGAMVLDCNDTETVSLWGALKEQYPNLTQDELCRSTVLQTDYYQSLGWRKRGYQQGLLTAPD